jgi:tRNA nucleotidyltransferase/poly(A) polymerase
VRKQHSINLDDPILRKLGVIARRTDTNIYLVGGYVRDLLLDHPGNDIDISVEGSGIEFAQIVAREFGSHPILFERFGTAMVPVGEY